MQKRREPFGSKVTALLYDAVNTAADVERRLFFCSENQCGYSTVKLLDVATDVPLTVTVITPVVAPVGTVVMMVVSEALVMVAAVPLNLTVLFARVVSKPVPVMATVVPAEPVVGEKLAMVGITVKSDVDVTVSLFSVTVIGPDVAPEGTVTTSVVLVALLIDAVVPLNLTVMSDTVVLKPAPVMVTVSPTTPLDGVKEVMASEDVPQLAKNGSEIRRMKAQQT